MNALGKTHQSSGYNMTLGRLLEGLDVAAPHGLQVTDLVQDSRAATPGCVFLACPGRTTHGLMHAAAAVERGAVAVLWEPGADLEAPVLPERVAAIAIPHLSRHIGALADRFFRRPSADLRVAGITGTNGKTTTAFLLAQASDFLGRRGWYVGTLGHGHPGNVREAGLTTPDAVTVQRRLAEARDEGASTLGFEVSSHALDQDRVAGVNFDTAVFTNLTRDHLDYHGTLEAYAAAKARLFHTPGLRCAVINVRDPFGRELVERLDPTLEKIVYTTANDVWAERGTGWIRVSELRATAAGLTISVETSWGTGLLRSRLVGEFNAENLLAVLGVLLGWNVPLQKALAALALCVAPPGRMESFGGGTQPLVLVDYAHSPDALAKVLDAARAHARGRLLCVFGCGGDRDPGKRPLMGGIAEAGADVAIVTDDNPRTEESGAIIAQILAGMRDAAAAHVVPDRAEAIRQAIAEAEAGDVVVVAGKGHEDYQIVGTET
ncbi:MAG: UDP-N-acetylmuramoyl-L-alanyl-D-glutamate--2,6-diaminopimelate ligase, partial [Steroidobacteraceae bacterium]|nr:UDP-N-acetylmuramoyl-L-alanyl-D-glutamate--2,6-diaminopimelate ligase [Steroidobacteraceae bacterium]